MKKVFFAIVLFLTLLEIGLRISGIFEVYSEKLGEKYRSYWGFEHEGHYKLLPQNQQLKIEQQEFSIIYNTNRFGFRNPEIAQEPSDSIVRILCMGDSFTEGDGASDGHSFPRQLETILNSKLKRDKYEVINGGVSGSDIIYCEKFFNEVTHHLKPHIVIFTICDSDIEDLIQRGGLERFKINEYTKFKEGPKIEKLYAKSHVVRFIVHKILNRTPLLLSMKDYERAIETANREINQSMLRIKRFCDDRNIEVRFVLHPFPAAALQKDRHFNLDTDYFQVVYKNKDEAGLVYNLNDELLDTLQNLPYKSYAWPVNGHFNDVGYQIMAQKIYSHLASDVDLEIN